MRVQGTTEKEEEQAAGWVRGGWLGRDGFRFRVSCLSLCLISKLPLLLYVLWRLVFIG